MSLSLAPTVRSQISTITMAAFNTTVASFNVGYADFFTEHMKKLCNPVAVPEIPVEPLACTNLPRSLTDSCINYSCLEEGENIEGTNNFVLKNGMLDLTVSVESFGETANELMLLLLFIYLSFANHNSSYNSIPEPCSLPYNSRLSCELYMLFSAMTSAQGSVMLPSTSLTACCS